MKTGARLASSREMQTSTLKPSTNYHQINSQLPVTNNEVALNEIILNPKSSFYIASSKSTENLQLRNLSRVERNQVTFGGLGGSVWVTGAKSAHFSPHL